MNQPIYWDLRCSYEYNFSYRICGVERGRAGHVSLARFQNRDIVVISIVANFL